MKRISIPPNKFSQKYIVFYNSDSNTQYEQRNIYLERKSMNGNKVKKTLKLCMTVLEWHDKTMYDKTWMCKSLLALSGQSSDDSSASFPTVLV